MTNPGRVRLIARIIMALSVFLVPLGMQVHPWFLFIAWTMAITGGFLLKEYT